MRPITAFGLFAVLGLGGVLAPACAAGDPTNNTGGSGGGAATTTTTTTTTSGTGGSPAGACLLHNCNSDDECGTCDGGRTHCLVAEHRCVACGANTTTGCPEGFECSSFGQCVPKGSTCPTNNGTPTITCNTSADCVACDPAHQVCDTATHQCVACTQNDTSECQSTDICKDGKCAPKCPSSCQTDNDCSLCGQGTNNQAKACNAHNCAQCSPTYACPAGQICDPHGICQKRCGLEGAVEGTCDTDNDCKDCGGGATHCYVPINGGHGKCGPQAAGCSDLGNGTITLPDPYNKVTNTCSNDADCAGVGITYNVGKLLRDLTGFEQINDANISYGMNACASVSISSSISCGICVPCKVDADCEALDIDQVAGDAFGALGTIGAALLLDQIFGPNDHKIHMYCQNVAAGYGVCAPCAGIVNDCTTGGGGSTGTCGHDPFTVGDKLGTNCGACEATVCGLDAYCCDTAWDSTCVTEANDNCSAGACHNVCTVGATMAESCDACVAAVCEGDPYCCQTSWDSQCVSEVAAAGCGKTCP